MKLMTVAKLMGFSSTSIFATEASKHRDKNMLMFYFKESIEHLKATSKVDYETKIEQKFKEISKNILIGMVLNFLSFIFLGLLTVKLFNGDYNPWVVVLPFLIWAVMYVASLYFSLLVYKREIKIEYNE